MRIEIRSIHNGYLVSWDFGLFSNGDTYCKTKKQAIAYSKLMLNKYGKQPDD